MEPQASMNITPSDLECMLLEDAEPTALPLSLLTEITNGFSDQLEIGRGGFAVVYKAMLDNCVVAVKRLSIAYKYEKEFNREVECLLKVKHKNIVRFLGYCADTQGNMASYDGKMVMADVQQRLLCFDYISNGSLERYITDSSEGLEWKYRYQIIKGICEGLNYLHEINIAHLDLKPGNILLDEEMTPKITDFGLSRCFEEAQTHVSTKNVGGTLGYLAPEFTNDEITLKFDLYSLGVIILEILTGKKGYQTVENVLESWSYTTLDTSQLEQIRLCAKIGTECAEANPAKRPTSMKDIIHRLAETESMPANPVDGPNKLLVIQQSVLCFPFKPKKIISCPLQLTNSTDKHVAFRLIDKSMESYLTLPLYGVVPPNTPYTLMVTTREKEEIPGKNFIDVILHSAVMGDEHVNTFLKQPDKFFQEIGNAMQEVKLKALYTPTSHHRRLRIMIGEHNGHVGFWDYQSQRKVGSLKLPATNVWCLRFIARKQWIVAGTVDGYVHVYSCETKMQRITSFRVHTHSDEELVSLAVHPSKPYLLVAGTKMGLWDWDKGWECVQIFELYTHYGCTERIYHVAFNHNGTFATCSLITRRGYDETEELHKVWSFDSPKYICTLSGHSDSVNCMAFFTCLDKDFMVTGSGDHTAKIWYLPENKCAYTLKAFVSPVTSVLYQPNLQTLIIGSKDGAIYLWSTTNCRKKSPTLTRIINIGCVGAVKYLACAMGSVVVRKGNTVAIMDIDGVNYQGQSMDFNKQQLSADMREHGRDTSKEFAGSISNLPILDVDPLVLRFPYHPNEPISCSLDLTNNTNENVAFRLVDRGGKSPWCFTKLPLYGIVPQRSTYTLIVTTKEEMKLKEKKDFDLIIQSSLLEDKYIMVFQNQSESDQFFEDVIGCGDMLHEVILKPVYLQYEDITSESISVKYNPDDLRSMDVHPKEPWILTGHRSGYARIWNHEMKYPIDSLKVSDEEVNMVKFVARKEWIVVLTASGYLHVYDCACVTKIEKITPVQPNVSWGSGTETLAVHPTLPLFVLSGFYSLSLLDWDLGCKRTQKFQTTSADIRTVVFNPGDHNQFAVGSRNCELQVWRLDSYDDPEYSLPGDHGTVNCLDFIRSSGDQHYLVSGSMDCTAKIWDLQKRECIYTMQAMSPVLCVLAHPSIPVLVTGTQHGIIQIWSSADFRLMRTINLGGGGPVIGLGCLMGSRRIVIGQETAISTMEIPDDEAFRSKSVTVAERGKAGPEHGETEEPASLQVLPPTTATEEGRSQDEVEHDTIDEPTSTQEQQVLPHKIVTEEKCSQAEAEHSKTQEPAAAHEQQALPPMSGKQRHMSGKQRRRLAKRAAAERNRAEAERGETEESPATQEQ